MATPAQNRFLADLQKATAGITYTPEGITQLQTLAMNRPGGASMGDLVRIANAPLREVVTPREGSTGQQVVDTGAGGSTAARQTPTYPTTLPPLSPEMLAAIEARRAASLRSLQEAEARAASLRQRAELENVGRMLGIEEEAATGAESGEEFNPVEHALLRFRAKALQAGNLPLFADPS